MVRESSGDAWQTLKSLPMGQSVEITDSRGHSWKGTIVPHHEFSADRTIQLKLESGYNVGIAISPEIRYKLGEGTTRRETPPSSALSARPDSGSAGKGAPIALLTTGGTIASRVDYETGGVSPMHDEREILSSFPEIETEGRVTVVRVLDRLSENVVPSDWLVVAQAVRRAFEGGAQGIVISHGTDTLGFTAAALSFLFPSLPGPVVLVGAQRSPDRPSSDGRSNLLAAAKVARDGAAGEVVVVMHAGSSDDQWAIHRGTRVRKMHSTRRDAFRSRNVPPLGIVEDGKVHWSGTVRAPVAGIPRIEGGFDERGGLLWFYPGLSPERAEAFARGLRGVVLAGTGLGHIHVSHLDWIRRATASGVTVAMTTQCLEGEVDPFVYATGRELLRAGVTYLGDTLPETAYVKLLWLLSQTTDSDEVGRRLGTEVAGELGERRPHGDLA